MSTKKKVCLDAGHDASNLWNASPDGTYYEHEFALDMAGRMEAILTRSGVEVHLTRKNGNAVSLEERAAAANAISGLDLFVSLHSNAVGGGEWSDASGWSIYTSAAGEDAERNKAANAILQTVRDAGVAVRKEALVHRGFYVLRRTAAPAILIEHGFHTNRGDVQLLKDAVYRDTLARAQCRGILAYLGLAEVPEKVAVQAEPQPSAWAREAWDKAVAAGILDGTAPQQPVTREQLAAVLDRLKLL